MNEDGGGGGSGIDGEQGEILIFHGGKSIKNA